MLPTMSTMQIYLDAMRHAKRTSQRAREQIANILLRENNARVADFTESMAQMPIIRYADEELLLKEGVTQCVSCGVVLGDVQRCGDAPVESLARTCALAVADFGEPSAWVSWQRRLHLVAGRLYAATPCGMHARTHTIYTH